MRALAAAVLAFGLSTSSASATSIWIREFPVYFAQDSSEIPVQFQAVVEEAAEFARVTDANVVVVTACTNTSETRNHPELAKRRWITVADRLIAFGVDPAVMSVGESHVDWFCSENRGDERVMRRAVIAVNPVPRMRN